MSAADPFSLKLTFFGENMQKYILDRRLLAAASFVPEGAILADIGSDHAYLPIHLSQAGRIQRALASDINDGPVDAARKNIISYGVCDKVTAQKSDGLDGVESFLPDCITILGMGGELIVRIIDRAPWVRNKKIRLILQPMTHGEILSRYLCEQGFEIVDETIVCDGERDDRIYRILVAEFDGIRRELTEAEHYVGGLNLVRQPNGAQMYIKRLVYMLETRRQGRLLGGLDCSAEDKLIEELEKYL